MSEQRTTAEFINEAMGVVDKAFTTYRDRELVSKDELTDVLLDVRSLLEGAHSVLDNAGVDLTLVEA